MKNSRNAPSWTRILLAALTVGTLWSARAFPPAPHHIIHGVVRDEMGNPISLADAAVTLETSEGVAISVRLLPEIRPGENYRLAVPMDSFTRPDPYKPTAVSPSVEFLLKVRIGSTFYVPLEMAGDLESLGQPAGETRINLTLGVDSDADGLPDAWEQALIRMLGGNLSLADIDPDGDADMDGVSNGDEYFSGTYAFDPEDALRLALVRGEAEGPVLEFLAITDRTYTVWGTGNLVDWFALPVRFPVGDAAAAPVNVFRANASQITEVEIVPPDDSPTALFFRLQVE